MLFQRRRQIKVLIELFQKFTEREAGLANIAFKRVFEGVRGNFSQVKKVFPLKNLFLYIKERFPHFSVDLHWKICGQPFRKFRRCGQGGQPEKLYRLIHTVFQAVFSLIFGQKTGFPQTHSPYYYGYESNLIYLTYSCEQRSCAQL